MTIQNGKVAEAEEVLNSCIALPFKNQAQLLYNSAYIGFNSKLNVTGVPNLKNIKYDIMTSDTATTKTQFTYNATDDLYYQSFGATDGALIFQTSGLSTVTDCISTWNYSLGESYLSLTTQCDFTSASRPTGWSAENSGTFTNTLTWDAANDEDDANVVAKGVGGNKPTTSQAYLKYDTTVNSGVVKVCIRNIVFSNHSVSTGDSTCQAGLWWGSDYIKLQQDKSSGTLGNVFIVDSEGGSYDTSSTSVPTTIWFKITVTKGAIKTEYSTSGDSNYTTLTSAITGGSGESKPKAGALTSYDYASTPTSSVTCSMSNFEIYSTPSYVNTLTVSISADGTHYEEVTDSTIHRFANTGTNLFIKFEIDRVDTSAVDKISEYAILWNCGAS